MPADDDEAERQAEALRAQWEERVPLDGVLPLADCGCNSYRLLVVRGAERGHIWELDFNALSEQWGPYSPVATPALRSVGFVEWLARLTSS